MPILSDDLQEVKRWWAKVHSLSGEPLAHKLRELECLKDADQIVTGVGLGLLPRMLVIRNALKGSTLNGFYKSLQGRAKTRLQDLDEVKKAFRASSDSNLRPTFYHPAAGKALAEWLDAEHPLPNGRRRHGPLILNQPFTGRTAIDDYEAWLLGRPMDALSMLENAPTYVASPSRTPALERLRAAMFPARQDFGRSIFVNVYQRSMWQGLSATAAELVRLRAKERERRKDENRPLLYIKLAPGSAGLEALSSPAILEQLRAFFEDADAETANLVVAEDVHGTLLRIRQRMARHPAIIMLDGYSDPAVVYGDLERAIFDDHVLHIVRRLCDPPIGHLDHPADLAGFLQNRVILFSDRSLTDIVPGTSVEMPLLHPGEVIRATGLHSLHHGSEVARILSEVRQLREARSEAIAFTLDALVAVHGWNREETIERSTRGLVATITGNLGRGPKTPEAPLQAVMASLTTVIEERRPEWFWMLIAVASAPGGLRRDTLRRLIWAARRVCRGSLLRDLRSIEDPHQAVAEMVQCCGAILTDRRPDAFDGLDEAHSGEFVGGLDHASADGRPRWPFTIDFKLPEVRDAFLARLDERSRASIHAIHRLLAEEALSQQTIAFRHNADLSSPRSLRRLLSALYHGFMSLPFDGDGKLGDPLIDGPQLAIPADPKLAWEWLYLFGYRRLIEQPPSWHLSRFYGLDGLKHDVLRLAARPWHGWRRYEGLRPIVVGDADTMISRLGNDPKTKRIAIDYYLSFAQTEYALGELNTSSVALEEALMLDGSDWSRMRVAKRQIDISLLRCEFNEAAAYEGDALDLLGPERRSLEAHIELTASALEELVSPRNFAMTTLHRPSTPIVQALRSHANRHRWVGSELSQLSDLFFRSGERLALSGEQVFLKQKLTDIRSGTYRKPSRGTAEVRSIALFCRSMAYFRVAEALRLQVFSDDPTGHHFFASGHSARQMARVALKLERFARAATDQEHLGEDGYFAAKARHMADVVARHLFRLPRERASMLILEAALARRLGPESRRELGLKKARLFLREAEPVVSSLGSRTRVRLRFLLERIKVHRRLAEREPTGSKSRQMFLEFCQRDVDAFGLAVSKHKLQLWDDLHEVEAALVGALGPGSA